MNLTLSLGLFQAIADIGLARALGAWDAGSIPASLTMRKSFNFFLYFSYQTIKEKIWKNLEMHLCLDTEELILGNLVLKED